MASDEVTGADLGDFFWNSNDLMSVLSSDGNWLIVNPAWPASMGWSLEDLRSGPFLDLIHPDDVEVTTVEFERLLSAPHSTLVEFVNRQRHRDGAYHWIEWSCLGRDGKVFSTGRDVTDRVLGQARLAESLEMTRSILNAAADPIIVIDRDLCVVDAGPATEQLHGYPEAGRRGRTVLDIIHPDDRSCVAASFRRAFDVDDVVGLHCRIVHVDGHEIPIEARARALHDDHGKVTRVVIVARDISESVAAETALAESLEMTQAILAAAPDSIIVIAQDLIVVEVSPGTERIYGIPQSERYGRSAMDVVHPDDRPAIVDILQQLFEGPTDALKTYRFRAHHVDGRWLTMEARARLLRDVEGRGRRAVLVSRDVTDAVAAQAALEDAKALAEQHDLAKSEFMSRMSHELRTPMTAVLGFTEILQMEVHAPKVSEMLEYIHSSGKHLLALIDDVLDVSRVDSGSINLVTESIALSVMVRECITLVTPQARTFGIEIVNQVACDFHVQADHQRLKQVIVNLMTNAVKYNRPNGTVIVDCRQLDGQCRLSVTDTGIGVAPEKMTRLFTPFDRLDAEATSIEGTGLGLSLSKSLAEAMGGSLGVESISDEGSTFWVEMPSTELAPGPMSSIDPIEGPTSSVPLFRDANILYVDDTVANLRLVELLLARRPGVHLITASKGFDGLELAREHLPDLILLDAWLPDVHGLHILRQLRDDPITASIPVFVISADASSGQVRRFHDAGVQEFFAKPIDLSLLLAAIDATLAAAAA